VINPHSFPRALKRHLDLHKAKLLDPKQAAARQNFEIWFDKNFGR
jgi:hypothetical protein